MTVTLLFSSCPGILLAFAAALSHMTRTLCMWETMPAMFRPLPSRVLARQASGGRLFRRNWLIRSLVSNATSSACGKDHGAGAALGISNPLLGHSLASLEDCAVLAFPLSYSEQTWG